MVQGWFGGAEGRCSDFNRAMLAGDAESMGGCLRRITWESFSYFDAGFDGAESFYHGFVLGLVVELHGRFVVRSNRESGYGRYDVCLEPVDKAADPAIVLEFKVARRGETLEDSVADALRQVSEKRYAADLIAAGCSESRVLEYAIAFRGKECLVGRADSVWRE